MRFCVFSDFNPFTFCFVVVEYQCPNCSNQIKQHFAEKTYKSKSKFPRWFVILEGLFDLFCVQFFY